MRIAQLGLTSVLTVVTILLSPLAGWAWTTPASWTETVLFSFPGNTGGASSLVVDTHGALYGTVQYADGAPGGYVFRLTPPTAGHTAWALTDLHDFGLTPGDGSWPQSGLLIDKAGALYGTAYYNGISTCDGGVGCGAVYKLSPPGSGQTHWTESILHAFTYADGAHPQAALAVDSQGNLYGTTVRGGTYNNGVVFMLSAPASGQPAAFHLLHSFGGYPDGAVPQSLVVAPSGIVYGTTLQGGFGYGVVFSLAMPALGRMHPTGVSRKIAALGSTPWTEQILNDFLSGPDGAFPAPGLVLDRAGALYGTTTNAGGQSGSTGTVFKLSPPALGQNNWTKTILFAFSYRGVDGGFPESGVTPYPVGGALLGTNEYGGVDGSGTAYIVLPPAPGRPGWTQGVIHYFGATPDGATPLTRMIVGADGVLYGTTRAGGSANSGTVFMLRHH